MQVHISNSLYIHVHLYGRFVLHFPSCSRRFSTNRTRLTVVVKSQVPFPLIRHFPAEHISCKFVIPFQVFFGKVLGVYDLVFVKIAPGSEKNC